MAGLDVELPARVDADRVARRHLLLAGVAVVGVAVRAYGLGAESLWYDEVFTAEVVAFRSLKHVLFELPRLDPHPTFYYVVLEGWTALAGTSAVGLRSLSVVADAGSIGLLYLLGSRLYDRRVGLLAGLLFALSPFYVWYGREARMYALLTLLTLASFLLLVRMGRGDRRPRTAGAYLLVTVAIVHTHALGPLVVAAQNVYLAGAVVAGWREYGVIPPRVGDLPLGRWVGLQAAVAVAAAPYYLVLYRQTFVTGRFQNYVAWVPETSPGTVWAVLGTYVGRTVPPTAPWPREPLWALGPGGEFAVLGEVVTLAALAVVAYALMGHRAGDGDRGPFAPEPLLAAWAFVPLVALYALSEAVMPLLYDRFTAPAGVAVLLLLAAGLVRLADARAAAREGPAGARDAERPLLAVAAAVVVVLAVPLAGLHAAPQKPQVREAVDVLGANAEGGDVLVVSPRWDDSYRYYLEDWPRSDSLSRRPDTDLTVRGARPGAGRVGLGQATVGADVVWLLVSFQLAEQRADLVSAMRELGYEMTRHEDLEKVDLYRFVDEG